MIDMRGRTEYDIWMLDPVVRTDLHQNGNITFTACLSKFVD